MKKLSTLLIIAFALVLGLSQCKKKVDTIAPPSDLGKTVHITVNVGGDKHEVFPSTGAVVYTDGDKIYVGDGSKYLGTLIYDSGAFSGDIAEPDEGTYFYFYFLGGLTPSATPVAGTTTDFTVSIANQRSKLPVLSFGRSTSPYTTSSATYGCALINKCGLVKFVAATATSQSVRVHGMKTTATIDFANPGITPTNATGTITLHYETTVSKWAILLPQDKVSTPDGMIGKYACTMSEVPEVTENMYSSIGVSMTVQSGMLGGLFTINENGGKVHFSQGNLQAVGTTTSSPTSGWTWRFADNQYDCKGAAVANTSINGNGAVSTNGTVDLFGWSTAATYYGINNSAKDSDYSGAFVDWGGTIGNTWRTLSKDEWTYLFNTRSNTMVNNVEDARFTKAAITTPSSTTVNGLILFPDSYSGGTPSGVTWGTINGKGNDYTTTCTTAGWNALEAAGCVFLPAASYRDGTWVDTSVVLGGYWTNTSSDSSTANFLNFGPTHWTLQDYHRYRGYAVRLARVVE